MRLRHIILFLLMAVFGTPVKVESVECPTISSSICGKTMKNNDSKFNQKPLIDWEPL